MSTIPVYFSDDASGDAIDMDVDEFKALVSRAALGSSAEAFTTYDVHNRVATLYVRGVFLSVTDRDLRDAGI